MSVVWGMLAIVLGAVIVVPLARIVFEYWLEVFGG